MARQWVGKDKLKDMYKRVAGVYQIQSISKPERTYVGSSAISIFNRWHNHLKELRKNKHHSQKLQLHYNKYGESNLEFSIIECGEYICKEHLLSREQGWFYHFKYKESELPYFNNEKIAGSALGRKSSEETKRKVGNASRSRPNGKLGKHLSDATKQLLREIHLGMKASDETKVKMREARLGRKQKESTVVKRVRTNHIVKNRKAIGEIISLLLFKCNG